MTKIWRVVMMLAVAGRAGQLYAAEGDATWQYTGTVVDEAGRAVAGAKVEVYQSQTAGGPFWHPDWGPQDEPPTVTDAQGGFSISAPPDASLVVVSRAGLAPAWKVWNADLVADPDPLVVTAPTVLAGVVVDEHDQPVAGAEVWVDRAEVEDEYSSRQYNPISGPPARALFSVWTGADGRFRITNFPANGNARLVVRRPGKAQYAMGNRDPGSQEFRSGQTNVELLLGPAGAVTGRVVVQETGQPLAGVSVWLGSGGFTEPVQSRADGTFYLPDVRPDKYYVMAAVSGRPLADWAVGSGFEPVTVRAGETVSNVLLHAFATALAEVTVVNANTLEPLANVAVSAEQVMAYTGPDGVSRLRVVAGKIQFSARSDWHRQNCTAEIKAGQTNEVRMELIPPPHITGTVRDPAGAPVAGARVAFHPGHYPNPPDDTETTTDQNGHYELILKTSREWGAWDIAIAPTSCILARSVERNLAGIAQFDTYIMRTVPSGYSRPTIEENETYPTHVDLTLQPGITLSGVVQDTEGKPISNADAGLSIEVFNATGGAGAKVLAHPLRVDARGAFSIPALPQGHYFTSHVTAHGCGDDYKIVLPENTNTNHYEFPPIVLKRPNRMLAGQVLGPHGEPVAGAEVSFQGPGQQEVRNTIRSDREGRFEFNGVAEGVVYISASAEGPPAAPGKFKSINGEATAQGGDTNVVVRVR
jgi:protocatechuate 3,4-dioxygenase beta subunit